MICKITVMRMADYQDLQAAYEKPLDNPCEMNLGQIFLTDGKTMPEGFCESAWETIAPFAAALARGGGGFYGEWMRNTSSAMISCNDGFRPVSFLLEALNGGLDENGFCHDL